MDVGSTSNKTIPPTAPTDTATVSFEETVVDDSDAEEKLALTNEYFIMDDPEEDFQQTENDIKHHLNNKVSPQSTESASPQVGSPSTTAQHCLPTFFTKNEKRPIETGAVSEDANVTVASAAEEKFVVANAFVKQHPKCEVTFSDRSCVVRVSHVKLLYMNTQESVSVRFLIRITKIIPNITTVRITSRLS